MVTTRRGVSAPIANVVNQGVLQILTQNMKECVKLAPGGQIYRRLSRGLHVVYARIDGRCRLALGREAPSEPSQQEVSILMRAFGVPAGSEQERRQGTWQEPTTERVVTFNVIELRWREVGRSDGEEETDEA
ncbi:MAG: hypothetical protein DCC55_15505 [Chloroflexi bacterium]|nr:MAG: hypothetical protein DCC55_15505 [Chloroflexota bacterium]